jgi:hypothetical protein
MLDQITEPKPRDPRALNAYRHGLTGQIHILTPADQVAYDKHCGAIRESLAPAPGVEADLVQSICDDRWRLHRAAAFESSIFAMGLTLPGGVRADQPEVDDAFAHARVWLSKGEHLALLSLYESRIQRRVEKNLALLRQLQQDRQAALEKAVEEASLLAQLAQSKGESYDIERDFPRESLPPQFDFSLHQIARLAAHHRRLAEAKKQFQSPRKPLRHAA